MCCVVVGVQPRLFYGRLLACPMQLRQGWLQGGNAPLEALRTQADPDLLKRVKAADAYLLNHAARAVTPSDILDEARALSTALELLLQAAPSNKKKRKQQAGAPAAAGKPRDKVTVALLIRPVFPLRSALHRDNLRAFMEALWCPSIPVPGRQSGVGDNGGAGGGAARTVKSATEPE